MTGHLRELSEEGALNEENMVSVDENGKQTCMQQRIFRSVKRFTLIFQTARESVS